MHEKMGNWVISFLAFGGNFLHFWGGNYHLVGYFGLFLMKNVWKFVKNAHFWQHLCPFPDFLSLQPCTLLLTYPIMRKQCPWAYNSANECIGPSVIILKSKQIWQNYNQQPLQNFKRWKFCWDWEETRRSKKEEDAHLNLISILLLTFSCSNLSVLLLPVANYPLSVTNAFSSVRFGRDFVPIVLNKTPY